MARCRSCGLACCRECVVEHEFRLVCADCLRREAERAGGRGGRVAWAAFGQWVVAAGVVWVIFYAVAAGWRRVPEVFHDGVIWGRETTDDR